MTRPWVVAPAGKPWRPLATYGYQRAAFETALWVAWSTGDRMQVFKERAGRRYV